MPLFPLPPHPILGVLDDYALFRQFIANLVGAGEVALPLGRGPLGHQRINSFIGQPLPRQQLWRHIGHSPFLLSPRERLASSPRRHDPPSRQKPRQSPQHGQNRIAIARLQLSLVQRRIRRAHQVEDRRPRFGGIQIVAQCGNVLRLRLLRRLLQRGFAPAQTDPPISRWLKVRSRSIAAVASTSPSKVKLN